MKTKYAGSCPICGASWAVGDEIFFEKEPKSICKNGDCFNKQKTAGGLEKLKSGAAPAKPEVAAKTPEQKLVEAKQMIELLWPVGLAKATIIYPDVPQTETFTSDNLTWQGQQKELIRQRMILAQTFFKAMAAGWVKQ